MKKFITILVLVLLLPAICQAGKRESDSYDAMSTVLYGSPDNGTTIIPLAVDSNGILQATGNFTISNSFIPINPTDNGTAGQMAYDNSWLYICTNTNTWQRVAIATWLVTRHDLHLFQT